MCVESNISEYNGKIKEFLLQKKYRQRLKRLEKK